MFLVVCCGIRSDGDGLKKPHDVGLWNSDGSILKATATVDTDLAGELDGHFRYTEITPVKLDAGEYVVGAYWTKNHDPYAYNPEKIIYNPKIP
jgi:hypothetical protein